MKKIYNLIVSEQETFRQAIPITDEWSWSFQDHVTRTIHYKNSIFDRNHTENKPFKNIVRPILNLAYRAEGFDVKDIVLYIEEIKEHFKSFLVKKFHEDWARKVGLDTFIDKLVESYVDFGGTLVKKTKDILPEVVPLQRIAFCDQSNMLGGPICEKHQYSPDELRTEAEGKGWENVEEVIRLSEEDRESGQNNRKVKTPGKYIQVYELHGLFPKYCLSDEPYGEIYDEDSAEAKLVRQVHIVVLHKDKENNDDGLTLFKGLEKENPYRVVLRDEIYGRALGLGGCEELFQDQIWTNYGMIRMKELLDSASKTLFKTTDAAFANRNKTSNLSNGEILVIDEGKDITQIDTTPRSMGLFDNFVGGWGLHSRLMGAAGEAIMPVESPPSRTPFASLQLQAAEGHSTHDYRRGKLATFVGELYQDWIIPKITTEITKGTKFLSELDLDEMQQIAEVIITNKSNELVKERILNGQIIYPEEVELFKQKVKTEFMKSNKKFIEILKDELKNVPMSVKVNVAGKQKYLSAMTDKLTNIFRQIMANPAVLQSPPMAKLFNQILESSGLDPMDFSGLTIPQPQMQPQLQQQPQLVGGGQPMI